MAFAVTTNPSSTSNDSMTRYFTTAGTVADLTAAASGTSSELMDALTTAVRVGSVDPASDEGGTTSLILEPDHVDPLLTRALARENRSRTSSAAIAAAAATEVPDAEVASDVPAPLSTPVPSPSPEPLRVSSYTTYEEPALSSGDVVEATVSFYYCQRGTQGLHPGDGGGFCGVMRDGTVVYPGAAACAYQYLGQQFRIIGDPDGRVYTCADTGSAVHGLHRDIWFMTSDEGWDWQRIVGQVAVIEILS